MFYRPREYFWWKIGNTMTGRFMSRVERRDLANKQYAAQFHISVQPLVLTQYK